MFTITYYMLPWILLPIISIYYYYYSKHHPSASLTTHTQSTLASTTIWITGASSGIGRAIALQAALIPDAQLILSARNVDALNTVAEQCQRHNQNKPLIVPLDLQHLSDNDDTATKLVADTLTKLSAQCGSLGVDVLINSGGVSVRGAAVSTQLSVDHSLMNTNYFGTVALTKAVVSHMQHQRVKRTVYVTMVSSVQGLIGNGLRSAYAASKFALHGFFESLRYELADTDPNIHITLACPGYVATNLSLNAYTGSGSKHGRMDANTASGQSADEVAARILNSTAAGHDFVLLADGKTHVAVWLYQMVPRVLTRIMAGRARKERLEHARNKSY